MSLSQLRDNDVRTVPVSITANFPACDLGFIKRVATDFKDKYLLRPIGCKPPKNGIGVDSTWETQIPILRSGDQSKIPHIPGSIYYSINNSIILLLKPDFVKDIKSQAMMLGYKPEYSTIFISLTIRNDTAKSEDIAVENVFINEVPIGRDMQIFRISPGGAINIRLSDIGVDTLFLGGVEAVGVFPALKSNQN